MRIPSPRRTVVTIAATAALTAPVAAWAGHGFDDVPASHTFHQDIDWLASTGVTSGCGGGSFCPDRSLTRAEMAAFLHRLDTKDVFLTPTDQAADADTVDGLDAADLLPRFAVLKYNLSTATLSADRGVVSWARLAEGRYRFTFDRDVRACAWNVTVGARNNATFGDGYSWWGFAHSSATAATDVIVQLHDDAGNDDDVSFNLAVSC